MELKKHNPHCKLVGLTINNKEFVYGIENNGDNPGLEIYYQNDNRDKGFYYSRRYSENKIPSIYSFLYKRLKALAKYVPTGEKLTLENTEYNEIAQLQDRYTDYSKLTA